MSVEENESKEEENVLVDLPPQPEFYEVSVNAEDIAQKSAKALDKVMIAIRVISSEEREYKIEINYYDELINQLEKHSLH